MKKFATTYKARPYTHFNEHVQTHICMNVSTYMWRMYDLSLSRHLRTHVFVYGQFVLPLYWKLLSSSLFFFCRLLLLSL